MCDFGIILGLASAGIGAVGSIQQANAAAAAANYNAQVQEMNAQISEENAQDALERGADEEQSVRRRNAQVLGQQQAALAANGVDLSFGSPLDTLVDTTYLGDLDALNVRSNAARENYNHRVQAVNQRAGAELFRMEAKSARTGGLLSAAGTVLTGGSNAAVRASKIGLLG
ncbi:MAG: hypothetical protein ABJN26_16090 [Stappiaceae bacterium]